MSNVIDLGEECGYVEIHFKGLTNPLRLDVYAECEAIEPHLKEDAGMVKLKERLVKVHGFPESISLGVADAFATHLYARRRGMIEELKKNASV